MGCWVTPRQEIKVTGASEGRENKYVLERELADFDKVLAVGMELRKRKKSRITPRVLVWATDWLEDAIIYGDKKDNRINGLAFGENEELYFEHSKLWFVLINDAHREINLGLTPSYESSSKKSQALRYDLGNCQCRDGI